MNPIEKIKALIIGGVVCVFLGVFLLIPALVVVGTAMIAAVLLGLWIFRIEGGGCEGRVRWRESESGEVLVGTCQRCPKWHLVVRGRRVASGAGIDSFLEKANEVAHRYDSAVPEVAGEIRGIVHQLEAQTEDPEVPSDS